MNKEETNKVIKNLADSFTKYCRFSTSFLIPGAAQFMIPDNFHHSFVYTVQIGLPTYQSVISRTIFLTVFFKYIP